MNPMIRRWVVFYVAVVGVCLSGLSFSIHAQPPATILYKEILPVPTPEELKGIYPKIADLGVTNYFQREKATNWLIAKANQENLVSILEQARQQTKSAEVHVRLLKILRQSYPPSFTFQLIPAGHSPLKGEALLVTKEMFSKENHRPITKQFIIVQGHKRSKIYDSIFDFKFSPAGRDWAYTAREGHKWFVVYDGQEQKNYNYIDSVVFSPDGQHWAYGARRGRNEFIVFDGQKLQGYDRIISIVFSPNSQHWVYTVEEEGTEWIREVRWSEWIMGIGWIKRLVGPNSWVVYDRQKQGEYDQVGRVVFSPDSHHWAYTAREGHKEFVVYDGEEQGKYVRVDHIVFSPDSQHWVYEAQDEGSEFVVYDGRKQKEYVHVGSVDFSPNSQHWAYLVKEENRQFLVYDGEKQKEYDAILTPLFSPDSQHWAYMAFEASKEVVVYDGHEQKKYALVDFPSFAFSPDSCHWAYRARKGPRWLVVYDGNEQKAYDDIGPIFFSPDSRHWAYTAREEHKWFVVYDGQEGKKYEMVNSHIYSLTFSPDVQHWAAIVSQEKGERAWKSILIDGVEYPGAYAEATVAFSPDSRSIILSLVELLPSPLTGESNDLEKFPTSPVETEQRIFSSGFRWILRTLPLP